MKEYELLPCPHCSGKADFRSHLNKHLFCMAFVFCTKCKIKTVKYKKETFQDAMKTVTDVWNNRSIPQQKWTTECPKRNGYYALRINHLLCTVVFVTVKSDDCLEFNREYITNLLSDCQQRGDIVMWCRLSIPL